MILYSKQQMHFGDFFWYLFKNIKNVVFTCVMVAMLNPKDPGYIGCFKLL